VSALRRLAVAAVFLLSSSVFAAPRVMLVRAKQSSAQFDDAVAAFKRELGEPVSEQLVDDAVTAASLRARIEAEGSAVVVVVGARAAQLVAGLDRPVVACMLLQASAAASSPKLVKVPLAVPARAQLEALKALAPSVKSVGILYDPRFNAADVEEARTAATALKLRLLSRSVSDPKDTPATLDALLPDVDALLLPADATVVSKAFLQYLVKRAFDRKLPVLTYSESFVRIGLLAALVPSYTDNGKNAARITKKLLEGATPIEAQAGVVMKGGLVVNTSAGRKIGLSIPAALLAPPTVVVGE
jgi:putative ABC transport system substrate-binding protein